MGDQGIDKKLEVAVAKPRSLFPAADDAEATSPVPENQSFARMKLEVAAPISSGDAESGNRITQTFGSYELTGTLASGGMGSVHLARQRGAQGFQRLVAFKRIHPHLMQNQKFCEMFIDEARIASRINHANVCRVFDFGESPSGYFITMEYLIGEPLSRVLRALQERKDLATAQRYPLIVARIIAGIAEGLHAAHSLRDEGGERLEVVHRDVSPQNLFVLYDGGVRVTDFGIAHARQRVHQTRGDLLKGKLSYMSPEQIERKPIDLRADLWSLGVVLWEALTLHRLFRGDSEGDTLMRVMTKPVPPPSVLNPNVPPSIDAITKRLLTRAPIGRYASARDVARDLERVLASSGDTIPTMDLAEWIADLFPEDERRSGVLQAANCNDVTAAPPPLRGVPDESIPPDSQEPSPSADWADPTTQVKHQLQVTVPVPNLPVALATKKPSRSPQRAFSRSWLAAAALTLLASVVAGGAWYARRALEQRAEPTSSPSVAVPMQSRAASDAELAAPAALARPVVPLAAAPASATTQSKVKATSSAQLGDSAARAAPSANRRGVAEPAGAPSGSATTAAPAQSASSSDAPTAGTLFLKANSGGAAEVFEGGTRLGSIPMQVSLSAGDHTLELRRVGAPSQWIQVHVRAGGLNFVNLELPKTAASAQ